MTTTKKSPRSNSLAALTGAALALPAIAQLAHAETAPTRSEFGYRYSQYQEDDLAASKVLVGDNERYEVDNHQFRLVTPINRQLAVSVEAAYETMSGASAYGTAKTLDGDTALIMSGASIDDNRTDLLATLAHYRDDGKTSASVGYSREKDFEALNAGVEREQLSADRLTTYSGGIGFSLDEIEPEQEDGINRVLAEDKWSVNGFVAIAKVLSPVWQVQGGLFAALHDGFLSDPYKARDIRPDERQAWGFTARSRYFLKPVNAALHADYRFFSDDWGIEAHTVELAWHQSLGDNLRVVPQLRYYSQSQADFYVNSDDPANTGYQSSDYRLSPFGALTYGLSVILQQADYRITLHGEQYDSDGNLALKNVDEENPALVSFTLLTVGIDFQF